MLTLPRHRLLLRSICISGYVTGMMVTLINQALHLSERWQSGLRCKLVILVKKAAGSNPAWNIFFRFKIFTCFPSSQLAGVTLKIESLKPGHFSTLKRDRGWKVTLRSLFNSWNMTEGHFPKVWSNFFQRWKVTFFRRSHYIMTSYKLKTDPSVEISPLVEIWFKVIYSPI